jgi:MoxR-like ATPase
VNHAIRSAADPDQAQVHPRATSDEAPNPESLALELRRIGRRLDEPTLTEIERAQLRDELSLLSSRCEWVANSHQRDFLQKEMQSLWPRFESAAKK